MIQRTGWRRAVSEPLDQSTGNTGASVARLLKTDVSSVVTLHLDAGGSTDRHARSFGQLVLCVDGQGTVEVDGEEEPLRVGEAVRWPPDVPHQLRTDGGISVIVVAYPETHRSWRVTRIDVAGDRWVTGVFGDTDAARTFKQSLTDQVAEGESVVLE